MRIIGLIGKTDSKNISITNFFNDEEWRNIEFGNENTCLRVYCDMSLSSMIISNESRLFISDDTLYALDNGYQKKLDHYEVTKMLENDSINFIEKFHSNFNAFLYDKVKDNIHIVSNRATAGRMFYLFWEDALFFSNDFALLLNIKGLNLNGSGFLVLHRLLRIVFYRSGAWTIERMLPACPDPNYLFEAYVAKAKVVLDFRW